MDHSPADHYHYIRPQHDPMVKTLLFTAIILAGDRRPNDAVAQAAGVTCKALSPVAGIPMIMRVIDALEMSTEVGPLLMCGPPPLAVAQSRELQDGIKSGRFSWMGQQTSPSASTYNALVSLPKDTPILLTTADHALLNSAIVNYFCSEARKRSCDVVVGVALHSEIAATYPDLRKTVLRFRDDNYCGCNLFAFLTPQGRLLADLWQGLENERKKPWRLMRILGWPAVMRYLLGTLSLDQALEGLSRRLGLRLGAIVLPFPEAAVDVDTVDDWLFVQGLATRG